MSLNGTEKIAQDADPRDILNEICTTAEELGDRVRIAEDEENDGARADARALWVGFRDTLVGAVRRSAVDAYYTGYTKGFS